jgi:ABC-type lipoprotein export system ATPase subunit
VIALSDVRKVYPSDPSNLVLKGVDLHIDSGEFVAVVGTSGSGKSTLLNLVGGLDSHYTGSVQVDGHELRTMDDRRLSAYRNRMVGFVFQQFNLLDHLTAAENVSVPAWFRGHLSKEQVDARAAYCLGAVGLPHKVTSRPTQLSGGEKQRVAIARALFNEPRIFLCDEPTGALDLATGAKILELFEALNRAERITLVVVTHDLDVAARAHRTIRIEDGRIVDDRKNPPMPVGKGEGGA